MTKVGSISNSMASSASFSPNDYLLLMCMSMFVGEI